MMNWILPFVLTLAPLQEDADSKTRALIDALRSSDLAERENAVKGLKELDVAAKKALEAASNDDDAEVAGHAKALLRRIALSEKIPANLKASIRGIVDRLHRGGKGAWAECFLEAVQKGT